MSGRWTLDKGVNDLRPFPRCGRFVTVAVPLALTALTAAWLFLGATPARTTVLWCSLVLLAASLAIWSVAVLRDGDRPRSETYQWAVRTASVSPGRNWTEPLHFTGTCSPCRCFHRRRPGLLRLRRRPPHAQPRRETGVRSSQLDSVLYCTRHRRRAPANAESWSALRRRAAPDRKNAHPRSMDDVFPRL